MKFRLDESQVGIKTARRNTNDLRYADDTTLMAENEEDLKSLLMRMKKENEKADSKFSIQKTKIMTSNLISSCQKESEKVEVETDFILLGLAWTVTAPMKLRCLLLGGKAMTNLVSVLKSRDVTLPTKVYIIKAMIFPIVIYGCESWSIKKAEPQRIDSFKLWC